MASSVHNAAALDSPVEIFYSYSHKDEKLRERLEKHLSILRREGVISGWTDRKISGGQEWAGQIDEHLNSARIILLLVSADFVGSDYCYDVEMKRAMERHEAGEARVIPVVLRPVDWQKAPFGKLQALPKDGKPIKKWADRDEAFQDVALGIRRVVAEMAAASVVLEPSSHTTGALPRICNLPHLRNVNFTGRDELLKQLHDALSSGKSAALTQALHGLGGVGKTQTAIEYIYRHAAEYEIAWWIRSEEPARLAADYAALAEALRLPQHADKDQKVVVQAVRAALASRGRWLLVFDNATGPEEVREFLPVGGSGHVLVTSRNPAFGGLAHTLKVTKMSEDEAVRFLLKRSGLGGSKSPPSFRTEREKKDGAPDVVARAAELARELGCLPLAIEHAGAYIEETGTSISSYLKTFRAQQKKILARAHSPIGYEATVLTTWELSFQKAEELSAVAGEVMNLCAFLAPDDIWREMLQLCARFLSDDLAGTIADDLAWAQAVGALRKYSLVEVQNGVVSVHRLVQAVARERLRADERKKFAGAVVRAMDAFFPFHTDKVETWALSNRELVHALISTDLAEAVGVEARACGRLLNNIGLYFTNRAEFSSARSAYERAMRLYETAYGTEHKEFAVLLGNLGDVVGRLGDWEWARACFERSLRISEASCGPETPEVATCANNLGVAQIELGYWHDARACLERALRIHEAVHGSKHPSVATDIDNLGFVLERLGDREGARKCHQRALKISLTVHGPEHPKVAIALNNLGLLTVRLGDHLEALKHFEQALGICDQVFGKAHPTTQKVRGNLEGLVKALKIKNGS